MTKHLILFFFLLPTVVWANSFKVTKVEGAVMYRAPKSFKSVKVALNQELLAGGRIKMKDGDLLTLTTPKKDEINLSGDTYMRLDDLSKTPSGGSVVKLQLFKGINSNKVHGLAKDESFTVRTPTAVAGVRGTEFKVEVDESGETDVSVTEGEVTVQDVEQTGAEVSVTQGKSATVKSDGKVSVTTTQSNDTQTGGSNQKNSNNSNNNSGGASNDAGTDSTEPDSSGAETEVNIDDTGVDSLIEDAQEQATEEQEKQIDVEIHSDSFSGSTEATIDLETINRQ